MSSKAVQYKYLYSGLHEEPDAADQVKICMDDLFSADFMSPDFGLSSDTNTMMDDYDVMNSCDFLELLQGETNLSDSSDSGVNLMTGGVQLKQEAQSSPSSPSSECGSEGYISGQDAFINTVVKTEDSFMSNVSDPSSITFTSDYASCLSSTSSSSASQSPTSLSPIDQTLIFMPQDEGHDPATQLLLPSDLSQFPGSVLSPSTSSSQGPASSLPFSSASSSLSSSSVPFPTVPVQMNSILKNKVQILPKPKQTGVKTATRPLPTVSVGVAPGGATSVPVSQIVVPKMELKPVSAKPAAAKKLVLTPEEFTKLTASGALRFQPPGSDPSALASANNVSATFPRTLTSSAPSITDMISGDFSGGIDHTKSKRQQRMIKNRESASLSRKRKKEYLTSLEDKVRAFSAKNQQLQQENEVLKSRVQQLHEENLKLRHSTGMSPHKKALLLVMAVFITFNLNAFSSLLSWEPSQNADVSPKAWAPPPPLAIRGRHLLSFAENSVDADFENMGSNAGPEMVWKAEQARRMLQFDEDLQHLLTRGNLNESVVAAHFCPIYFNSTESSRLAEQLRGWMIREEEVKQKKQTPKARSGNKKKAYPPINTLKAATQGHFARDFDDATYSAEERGKQQKYQMQIFQHKDPRQRLLSAIPRRNDTFYVLSFNTDYFLVPATAHNKTARPRMSLVMPVVSDALNDTMQPPEGSVGMMQIDCEILDTQLIHIRKSVFPQQPPARDTFSSPFDNYTSHSTPHGYHSNDTSGRGGPRHGEPVEAPAFESQSNRSAARPPHAQAFGRRDKK